MAGSRNGRAAFWIAIIPGACAVTAYAVTAYPAITWWDSGQYSLAALTLGITGPPGSLLLTLLGWLATRLPVGGSPAFALNTLAGILAALAVCLVSLTAVRLGSDHLRPSEQHHSATAFAVGAAAGALAFAFSRTFWEYATQFTPYVLTTVFTGLILWAMVRWSEVGEERPAWRWLLLLGLLFGLDFSVHRTNLLLLPGLFVWILLLHPRTLLSPRAWIAGVAGMVAGLAFHLLLIAIAASRPALNMGDPSNWSRFYDYVSLRQMGGGWLVKLFPRSSPFWGRQAMDLVRAFGATFSPNSGGWGLPGLWPLFLGVLGAVLLWLRSRRTALAILALLFVHAAATVFYFNIPASFFRTWYRHYLPVFLVFAVLISYGAGALLEIAWSAWRNHRRSLAVVAGLAVAGAAISQFFNNWREADASRSYFTEDYAANTLAGLPENAILFTNGDNDTWPLWYMQAAFHLRPDVLVLNLPLLNTPWFVDQAVSRDADLLSLTEEQRHALSFREWPDTTITVPVSGPPARYGLPDSIELPAALSVRASPTIGGKYAMVQDQILLDILGANEWRRPLCFAVTVSNPNRAWLVPYCRLDGLFWRAVPFGNPPENADLLRQNLLGRYKYRGYADPHIRVDDVSRMMARNYYPPFIALAMTQAEDGNPQGCARTREQMTSLLPPDRLGVPRDMRGVIDELCRLRSGPPGH